jgi:hypothetical protein
MFDFLSSKTNVLAIGSVHLDSIAVRPFDATDDGSCETGSIVHAIGGSIYNIAWNLARHDHSENLRVGVYTILPAYSLMTQIFDYKFHECGIDDRFVQRLTEVDDRPVRGGGFVSVIEQTKNVVRLATVDAAIHQANLFGMELRKNAQRALDWAEAIVIDTDLSAHSVNHIARHASKFNKPLFVSLGSRDAAISDWINDGTDARADVVAGRASVVTGIIEKFDRDAAGSLNRIQTTGQVSVEAVASICKILKARAVLIIHGLSKYSLLTVEDEIPAVSHFDVDLSATVRQNRGNSTGLLDAGFAAVIGDRLKSQALNVTKSQPKTLEHRLRDRVLEVAESEGPTPKSIVSFSSNALEHGRMSMAKRAFFWLMDVVPVHKWLGAVLALTVVAWLADYTLKALGWELPQISQAVCWIKFLKGSQCH